MTDASPHLLRGKNRLSPLEGGFRAGVLGLVKELALSAYASEASFPSGPAPPSPAISSARRQCAALRRVHAWSSPAARSEAPLCCLIAT